MITVIKKDGKESLENLIRRFNRRVQSSNVIVIARSNKRFEKPISKTERRKKAIIRTERRLEKIRKLKLGIR